MGNKQTKIKKTMKVAILALLVAVVASQAVVQKRNGLAVKKTIICGPQDGTQHAQNQEEECKLWLSHIAQDNWLFQRESYNKSFTQLLQIVQTSTLEEDYKP